MPRMMAAAATPTPNTAPQAGLRFSRFRFMQAVIRSTSGISALHSRITSGVQACCISGVPRYCAFALENGRQHRNQNSGSKDRRATRERNAGLLDELWQ